MATSTFTSPIVSTLTATSGKDRSRSWLLRVVAPVALTFGLGLFATGAFAQGPEGGKASARIDRLCEKLECTDTQRTKIEAAFKDMQAKIKPIRQDVAVLRKDLAAAYEAQTLDLAKLSGLRDQLAEKERAVEQLRFDAMVSLHPILTAEQRAKIARRLASQGGEGGKRGGRGGKGGHGGGGGHAPNGGEGRGPAPSEAIDGPSGPRSGPPAAPAESQPRNKKNRGMKTKRVGR